MKGVLGATASGLVLGYALSRMGFSDFSETHRLFTLSDPRLLLTFGAAVVLTGLGLALAARGRALPARPLHPGSLLGGALFGAGWAITGACPGAALVQIGEGRLPALLTLAGVVTGALAYRRVHACWFRWDRGGCEID